LLLPGAASLKVSWQRVLGVVTPRVHALSARADRARRLTAAIGYRTRPERISRNDIAAALPTVMRKVFTTRSGRSPDGANVPPSAYGAVEVEYTEDRFRFAQSILQ
jgi:hypothetical protein